MALGYAFWGSKTLLSAIELDLFSELARAGPLDAEELGERLGLHPRGARDFFDALVALDMLERDHGRYSNTPNTDRFLDRAKPTYAGPILELMNDRFRRWASLTESLRTGLPQNETAGGDDFFSVEYSDPAKARRFAKAMSNVSAPAARALARRFPWERYETVIDVGCAEGCAPVELARAHDHLRGGGFDLPAVRPVFEEYIEAAGMDDRLRFHSGDFFKDPLPTADVLVMGHILHDWDLSEKQLLLNRAHAALREGGALIVYEALIDDERRENALGLLMSLNVMIETPGGFDYTGADCRRWMRHAGFQETYIQHLVGFDSMVVGIK